MPVRQREEAQEMLRGRQTVSGLCRTTLDVQQAVRSGHPDARTLALRIPFQVRMYPYLLSVFSGLLLTASFPTTDWGLLAWAGFVPFFIAIEGRGWRETFRVGYAGGVAFYWSLFYWLNNVTVAGFLVLTLYLALYFPLFGILMNFARRRIPVPWWVVAPLAWTALEYMRTYVFTGLPWGVMGVTQHRALRLIQFASVTGVYGVSFLVVLVNAALYECAVARGARRLLPPAVAALAVALALIHGGWWMGGGAVLDGRVRVAVVQGNVPQEEKFGEGFAREIIEKFHRLTRRVKAAAPDLVVWPETSVPGYYWYDPLLRSTTATLQEEMRTPLLLGSVHVFDLDNPRYTNCAFLVDERGEPIGRYDKIHLVLFGEIIPCKGIFPFLKRLVPYEEDFTPGTEFTVFPLAKGNFSALICFEDILPDLARNFVKRGARFLVNVTNDAWFGRTSQPYQQAAHAVFRCVENCVGMVRATNTGLSCFIDPFGRVSGVLRDASGEELFVEGTAVGEVRLTSTSTFYTRRGNVFAASCAGVATAVFAFGLAPRKGPGGGE